MLGDVTFANVDSIPLAVVRRQARPSDLSRVVPDGCGVVWTFVRARKLSAGRNVALYWDGTIRLDVGVELGGPFEEEGDIVRSATPAGPAVTVAHFGPYHQLGSAHEAIHQWCSANNRRLAGPSWEIYGHWQDEWNADPSRIRTDIYYLLTPA